MILSLLFFTFAIFLFSAAGLSVSVSSVNPFTAGPDQLMLFYLAFWLTATTLLTMALYRLRPSHSVRLYGRHMRVAGLISAAATLVLILLSHRLLSFTNTIALVTASVLLEMFFRSSDKISFGRLK